MLIRCIVRRTIFKCFPEYKRIVNEHQKKALWPAFFALNGQSGSRNFFHRGFAFPALYCNDCLYLKNILETGISIKPANANVTNETRRLKACAMYPISGGPMSMPTML
jgi:hypothetical protein